MARHPALLWLIVLAACGSDPQLSPEEAVEIDGGSFSLELRDAQHDLYARARLEGGERFVGVPRAYRLIRIDPPARAAEHGWVWCHLATDSTLTLPDGRTEAHPDLAVVAELRSALATTPPDVEGVIAGLPRLRRLSSRGKLLSELPAVDTLPPPTRAALLEALTTERARLVLAEGPDGVPAGGSQEEALLAPVLAFAAYPGLKPSEAEALLEVGLQLGTYEQRRSVLDALQEGRQPFPVATLIRAAEQLSREDRAAMLLELARRPKLSPAEGRQVLQAGMRLESYDAREAVLRALIGDPASPRELLSVEEVLATTSEVSRDEKAKLVLELSQRSSLGGDDVERVLRAGLQLESYEWREAVLRALIGPKGGTRGLLSVEQVLATLSEISRDKRAELIVELAQRQKLSQEEAKRVLQAGLQLESYDWREAVLRALIGPKGESRGLLSVEQILAALSEISRDKRYALLVELAHRSDLSRPDATRVLGLGVAESSYDQRKEIIVALMGKVPRESIANAAKELDRDGEREVLKLLAGLKGD